MWIFFCLLFLFRDVTMLNNNNAHTVNQNQINNNNMLIKDNNNVKSVDLEEPKDQPDPDYIKMFVGQVPRTMDEAQLKEMFEEFGRVHQINVLRDKTTGLSKGEQFLLLKNCFIKSLCVGGGLKSEKKISQEFGGDSE